MSKQDFYIGYSESMPKETSSFLKKRIWLIVSLLLAFALIFALGQKRFSASSFELGKLTDMKGVLYMKPYPMLKVRGEDGFSKNVLLLGFGKFGAENDLKNSAETLEELDGLEVTLKGTLIYYDGKALMQLEPGENEELKGSRSQEKLSIKSLGNTELKGEIIDPKCYFGVMKPGSGKIHRSCAIRCISGGIPPVLAITGEEGNMDYVLLVNPDMTNANASVLNYIGKPVSLKGSLYEMEDWLILESAIPNDLMELGGESEIY